MAMSSSSREKNDVLPELRRQAMHANLFIAAIKGDKDVLTQRLGLPLEVPIEIQVTIELSNPDIRSATRLGDTLLHLLIANKHNELVLKVLAKDTSLLRAHNNKLETPLYCAAMVGNDEVIAHLIQCASIIVRDALRETNENGDTALHVAASNNHKLVVNKLMILDPEAARKENKQGFSPLYIAIVEGNTSVVKEMLAVDDTQGGTLAYTQFSDRTFPVHVAARMGNRDLVGHFLQERSDYAMLLDPCGRNLFHFAAEQDNELVFTVVFANCSSNIIRMVDIMVNATDYDGNTPLHIAAMKGHRSVMRAIWGKLNDNQIASPPNQKGQTPFDLSVIQVKNTNEGIGDKIDSYVKKKGSYFTLKWFDDIMKPPFTDKLGGIQVIGLGAVLITTLAFASAFTIPGGYNEIDGTPILGRRYMYRSFVLANTLAFVLSFTCVLVLVSNAWDTDDDELQLAQTLFLLAAAGMVMAFGLGSYVMLAPVSKPIAIIVLVVALFFSFVSWCLFLGSANERSKWTFSRRGRGFVFSELTLYVLPLLLIFCLALL